jgi:hypothetical protein
MLFDALVCHHRFFFGCYSVTGCLWPARFLWVGNAMPQSIIAESDFIEVQRPPCPKCHGPMTFVGAVLGSDGLFVRSFECTLCNFTEKVTVVTGQGNAASWFARCMEF